MTKITDKDAKGAMKKVAPKNEIMEEMAARKQFQPKKTAKIVETPLGREIKAALAQGGAHN
tara:strand:+ start:360 stop:542 length:183 start_codon:yes stop_codon:yes gene_type:complete